MNFQEKLMKSLGNFFSKNIVTLLIVGGVAFLVWKFREFLNPKTLNLKGNIFDIQSKSNEALKQIAEMQDAAMNEMGTDEELLFQSLEGLNRKDLVKVFNYFGLRKYVSFTGQRDDIAGHPLNLFLWYKNELSGKDLKKMKSIWENSGLEITF